MVPFQVIFLLILASVPAALPEGLRFLTVPQAWGLLLGGHLGLIINVWWRARWAMARVHGPTGAAVTAVMDRIFQVSRWATLLVLAMALYDSNLPQTTRIWTQNAPVLRLIPLAAETIFVLPTILSWLAFWTAAYFLETANRERALPYRLAQGLPAHAMPTLGQFLGMQIRHNFYILVPIGVHNVIVWGGRMLEERGVAHAEEIAGPVGIVIVLMLTPWILARVWSTVPLTGPLRERLDAVAGMYKLRFRNILVWRTHNAVSNAAILGWVPWARYFLMTDALLETLTDKQLEAVFAHEVGHGVHRHILWYIGSVVGAAFLAFGAAVFWDMYLPPALAHVLGKELTPAVISMGLLGLFFAVGFRWMSHRFEHQADYFASLHMAKEFAGEVGSSAEESASVEAAVVQATALPPEIGGDAGTAAAGALSLVETPAEVVTLQQYVTGAYPHAGEGGSGGNVGIEGTSEGETILEIAAPEAGAIGGGMTGAYGRGAIRGFTPAQAGAEVFISALDTILELSHRSRNRAGWMHPSPNARMALLRELARDTRAAARFGRRMVQTRLVIVALILAGVVAGAAGTVLQEKMEKAQKQAQQGVVGGE